MILPDVFTRPEHIVEYMAQLLEEKSGDLGLRWIGKYEENLIPEYPAALIQPGNFSKELHGTATFMLTLRATIYVMHADLTQNHRTRSLEDCLLATNVITALEEDKTFGGAIMWGLIESDQFAALPPRSQQSPAVISTRLSWMGIVETRFK